MAHLPANVEIAVGEANLIIVERPVLPLSGYGYKVSHMDNNYVGIGYRYPPTLEQLWLRETQRRGSFDEQKLLDSFLPPDGYDADGLSIKLAPALLPVDELPDKKLPLIKVTLPPDTDVECEFPNGTITIDGRVNSVGAVLTKASMLALTTARALHYMGNRSWSTA